MTPETEKITANNLFNLSKDEKEKRIIWSTTRAYLEIDNYKHKRRGEKSKSQWSLFLQLISFFSKGLKWFNLYERGVENALSLKVNKLNIYSSKLPEAFNGFKVLQLSDLHIDSHPKMIDVLVEKVSKADFDICVITGDYRHGSSGSYKHIISSLKKLNEAIGNKIKTLAVLGNHDTYLLVDKEEELGWRFLLNETISIEKDGEKIEVTGTDDPFYFYTDSALTALQNDSDKFKIALVHTSELSDVAADYNYDLYLCGHTHGGQICLPGGTPLITHQSEGRDYNKENWKLKNMIGYTSSGSGTSAVPLRYNCDPEITIFTLLKQ